MFCSNCGNRLDEGIKFCANCGKKIDDKIVQQNNIDTDIPMKQTVPTPQNTAEEYTQKIPTSTGKRNPLLLISAIIGSALIIILIILIIREMIMSPELYVTPDKILSNVFGLIAVIICTTAIIFTFLAWGKNKALYVLISGIIFMFTIFPLGILNLIALHKMKEEK